MDRRPRGPGSCQISLKREQPLAERATWAGLPQASRRGVGLTGSAKEAVSNFNPSMRCWRSFTVA